GDKGDKGDIGNTGSVGPAGPAGPTLGIYDSLGLSSTGSLSPGDAGGRNIFNLGKISVGDIDIAGQTKINNVSYAWPSITPGANQFLSSDNSGNLSWQAAGTGDISGIGANQSLAVFTGSKTIGNSILAETNTGNLNLASGDFQVAGVTRITAAGQGIFSNITLNGGTIDNTVIGATTPAAGNFTTLTVDDNAILGSSNTDKLIIDASLASHLIPDLNGAYDLGSNTKTFRSAYINNSLILGGNQLSIGGVNYLWPLSAPSSNGFLLSSDIGGGLSWINPATLSNDSGWTDDGTSVRLNTPTDKVGIGTSVPTQLLHLSATSSDAAVRLDAGGVSFGGSSSGSQQKSVGTAANVTSFGTRAWSNPNRILSSNNSYAQDGQGGTSNYL
ncbi:MAG: hypothetical protein AAB710_01430, partial [Patescibacteria group bacterium]